MAFPWHPALGRGARVACRLLLGALFACAALQLALLVLGPLAARQPGWVAARLGAAIGRPVSFAALDGRWSPSGPVFVLRGVTIGAAGGEGAALRLPEVGVKLDLGSWLLPSRHLLNFSARGLRLDVLRDAAGWHLNGIGLAGSETGQRVDMGRLSAQLWLSDLGVAVHDAVRGRRYTLEAPRLRLSRQGHELRFAGFLRRGGVAATVRAAGRLREDGSAGRAWAEMDGAELKALFEGVPLGGHVLGEGAGRLALWVDWQAGQLRRAYARFALDALEVTTPGGARAEVAELRGLAGLERMDGEAWQLRWADARGGRLRLALAHPGGADFRLEGAARGLNVAPFAPWLALVPGVAPALADWLGQGRPRGTLETLRVGYSRAHGLEALGARFSALGLEAVGKLPGLDHLDGTLRGDATALALELPAQAATLRFPGVFREPFVLTHLAGNLAAWQAPEGWHLGVAGLDFTGAGYAGSARGELTFPAAGGLPFLELYARVDQAEVPAAKLFWPVNVMPAGTVAWLDHALVAGRVEHGDVLVRGSLADWPFRHNEGRFEARAEIDGLTLAYGADWPAAENVRAVANFINGGMLVEADAGGSLGVVARRAVALIPDFHTALLDLNVDGSGPGAALLAFARRSPIARAQAAELGQLRLAGRGDFSFHLVLPLAGEAEPVLAGSARLAGATLAAPAWKLKLEQLEGPLAFDLGGLHADALKARLHGVPATLTLAVAGATGRPDTLLAAGLSGDWQLSELVVDYPDLAWIGALGSGRAAFDISYRITREAPTAAAVQTLGVRSTLAGIALDLPAPLAKPAAASLPLALDIGLPLDAAPIRLALGDTLRGLLRAPDAETHQPLAAALAWGQTMPTALPPAGLRIRGHAAAFDVTGWVARAVAGTGADGSGPALESLDMHSDQTEWFGRQLGAMQLRAAPESDTLRIEVDGAALAGHFSVPTAGLDKRGVTARLDRLHWPRAVDPDAGEDAPAPADPAATGVNPAALPPLHLWVGDLRLGDSRLGEARLETWPTAKGMHIEQLRSLSREVQLNGSGEWNGDAARSHTRMKLSFAAENLGAMLGAFGYDGLVEGGRTRDALDAVWPGSPSDFALANMDGTLKIHVSDGRIPEAASPGVGRLLGLVSLAELPRRLTLDFGDVFGKGLAFDTLSGDFRLADGSAYTSNLLINGPAAEIRVRGRTGLRARDYDQEMQVVPRVGNSLPVVGAVVGGPVGAAAGLAVQGLLGRGLNRAASARYRITGSWDKPLMTTLEKTPAGVPLEPAAPTPALSVPDLPAPAPAASVPVPAASTPAPAASATGTTRPGAL